MWSSPARAQTRVRHLPPAESVPAVALELTATISEAWNATLELHYRPVGDAQWTTVGFERTGSVSYKATIPAVAIRPPAVDYYIVSRRADLPNSMPHFASERAPHRVLVHPVEVQLRAQRQLARYKGRRAMVRVRTEYVNYGSRRIATTEGDRSIPDQYLRIDADFTYRLLKLPLHSLRFGYTRLIGQVPRGNRDDDGSCGALTQSECTVDAGFKVGGWFELGLHVAEDVAIDARGMVLATTEGFNVGGRVEFRLGNERATHVALGGEFVADVGNTGFFRLGWGTVPGFPMAATVEVTDFPASHRALGVRLVYDVAHPFDNGVYVGLRAGYQARDQMVGGVSAGLNAAYEF